ncbi:anaerobic ribonucleoside-triphosphate reductase activating protein [Halomonas sp. MCCC 1A17488]|uniref:anaerobic ribonucleoside-triphosphate reductase activating protein n=1 Tax=unclassified Halomonas TaxID=2609666 RepID=UPI0018D2507A|nr:MULTISPECIES: anaerobic ribonucleoside-triphosphate reductase activating protein [unclassified Halomonas]MCE8017057.1 anaerobic ribonucleoside-triphosphate reductase activating protein [Halomonas sp. MCCC 1A17488]MCG3240390.1 anaerobic ribonucleoside-triphosphate reductase activating protein [Halomonas sp. MCCC 1A17488]QPP49746.1 anaerobic ribonucleoside-triphosphate reductase activating protein [Halomonas sp. SS10-MC5]
MIATDLDPPALAPLDGIRLPIAGLTQMTTLDYPDHLACVVFLQGCPLRCGYCHNDHMMPPRRGDESEWQAVREFLESRRGLLEAVVFSGGEPTLHNALPAAVREVKAMGFKVGLHTAGPYPARLSRLLPWLDWVGLDVKGRGSDFDRICGRPGIWQRNSRCLMALLNGDVDFECRTTVHWRDFSLAEVERLALTLADCGVRRYAIQVARTRQCLDPAYCQPVENAPPRAMLAGLVRRLAPHFERIELRE